MPARRDDKAFLKIARERWEQAETADKEQRRRELDDLRFYAGDQWPDDIRKAREGQVASGGMPPVASRPTITINKQREPVRQVLNMERQADFTIELVAGDDFGEGTSPELERELEVREGLVRRIQRSSEAADARTWAFTRSTIAGRGYYAVMTRYAPGKTWNQEIYIHRFYNQAAVMLDPSHEQPDGSDAEWAFVGTDMPWAEYEAEFPEVAGKRNPILDAGKDEFRALGDEAPGWFRQEGETRIMRVVEYWYTERTRRTLVRLADGTTGFKDELPDTVEVVDSRPVIEKAIKWAKIDGAQVLDKTDWSGPDLPIIKVLGEELQPYDTERRAEGMVRQARGAQEGFNSMISKWVETIAYTPILPFQVAEGQVEGYEAWYQAAATRALPYLPYKTTDLDGREVGPPQRTQLSTPIEAIAGSVNLFDQAIKSTTGVPDPNLGRQDPSVRSGKMAVALIQQSQHGTSNYLDNLQRSMRREGQIINNLLYPLYGQGGRSARILTPDGQHKTVRLNMPEGSSNSNGNYQLTPEGTFEVVVKVTRGFVTRRAEEAQQLADLLSANPNLLGWFGDLFFENQDGPGHKALAERAKVMLDPKIQQMLDQQKTGQVIPPAAMAHMRQLQNQLQQAEALLQKAHEEITTKQTEWQAKAQIAAQEGDRKASLELELARIKAETQIAVAEITKKADVFLAERERIGVQQSQADAQDHEAAMRSADAGHEAAMGQQAADIGAQQSAQDHQQTLEQQTLAPQPSSPGPAPQLGAGPNGDEGSA